MKNLLKQSRKAPWGAFFIGWLFSSYSFGLCELPPQATVEAVQVANIHDGDTVRLEDGRRVRLVGINTPEVANRGKAEEPLAQQARQQLVNLLKQKPIYMKVGEQETDHYGRILGHLYDVHGVNITAELLQQGAGFQVAIPPNLSHAECYSHAEDLARQNGAGVWAHPYYKAVPSDSDQLKAGYARVVGRVESVSLSKKAVWVELEGNITLKLEKRYGKHVAGPLFDQVVALSRSSGQSTLVLEAQGWLSDRLTWRGNMPELVKNGQRKRFQMKIHHKSAWKPSKMH